MAFSWDRDNAGRIMATKTATMPKTDRISINVNPLRNDRNRIFIIHYFDGTVVMLPTTTAYTTRLLKIIKSSTLPRVTYREMPLPLEAGEAFSEQL